MKITILRKQLPDGRRWWIGNWADYLKYLDENNIPKPAVPYGIFVDPDTEQDYRCYYGDFEQEVPLLFRLRPERVEYEILDA